MADDSGASLPPVGALFDRAPFQWGMRGDPYAWGELAERLADHPLPSSWFDMKLLLQRELDAVVGQRVLTAPAPIHVARFDPGRGMSAGMIDPVWWKMTGIPILLDRYAAVVGSQPSAGAT